MDNIKVNNIKEAIKRFNLKSLLHKGIIVFYPSKYSESFVKNQIHWKEKDEGRELSEIAIIHLNGVWDCEKTKFKKIGLATLTRFFENPNKQQRKRGELKKLIKENEDLLSKEYLNVTRLDNQERALIGKSKWTIPTLRSLKISSNTLKQVSSNLYAHEGMDLEEIKDAINGFRATAGNFLVVSKKAVFEMSRKEVFKLKFAS